MRLGNLAWNILNFILLLGVMIVLAWPLIGPTMSKNKFKTNRKSFVEYYFDDKEQSSTYKKEYSSTHPLGTDSNGRDKMLVLSNATIRNIQYAFVAVIPYLFFGIFSGLILSFIKGRESIGIDRKYIDPMKVLYYGVDWAIKILHSFPVVIVLPLRPRCSQTNGYHSTPSNKSLRALSILRSAYVKGRWDRRGNDRRRKSFWHGWSSSTLGFRRRLDS